MENKNKWHNSILQALLDLEQLGYAELNISEMIDKLSTDAELRETTQEKWNSHRYPSKSITFTQLNIHQELMKLSNKAFKLLMFLGMFCEQTGGIQIKSSDMMRVLGLNDNRQLRRITSELQNCGAIKVIIKNKGHQSPVYSINSDIFRKGSGNNRWSYDENLKGGAILKHNMDYVVKADTITTDIEIDYKDYDGEIKTKLVPYKYASIRLENAEESDEQDTQSDSNNNQSNDNTDFVLSKDNMAELAGL